MYNKLANFYDELGWAENASLELDIINNVLIENNFVPESYLDLGCGTGELIKVLNEMHDGCHFTGVDISEDMISQAKKKLKDEKNVKLYVSDMRTFKPEKRVDVITCMYDTINHLLKKEYWNETFKNVYESLKYGGIFVMDFVPQGALKKWAGTYVNEYGSSTLVRSIKYDKENNILTSHVNGFVKANYFGTYRNVREDTKETSLDLKVVIDMLKKAGFKEINVYNEDFKKYKFNFAKANKEMKIYISAKK